MKFSPRTDLALDRWELAGESELCDMEGVDCRTHRVHGIRVQSMIVKTADAAKTLCKPAGKYETISLEKVIKRCDDGFIDGAKCVGESLRKLMPSCDRVLIACMGNPNITPDAIGPLCADSLMVTRHLKAYMPKEFAGFREVSVLCPGVLGTTGIESAAIVKGAVEAAKPECVIAIDALAARSMDRLCNTIQICNTGIEPGSGVGNRRYALNKETLGVPVIAAGVPTVVDAGTLIYDLTGCPPDKQSRTMMITPREIDSIVAHTAKLLAYGINFALHPDITLEEIDLFVT